MEKRAEIVISGRVQKAGFRNFVDEIAFHLNLNGYVKNLDDGTVQVVCEGEEDLIREFLDKVNIVQYPIRVKHINVVYKEPIREYKIFEIIWNEDPAIEAYERIDAFVECLRKIARSSAETFKK